MILASTISVLTPSVAMDPIQPEAGDVFGIECMGNGRGGLRGLLLFRFGASLYLALRTEPSAGVAPRIRRPPYRLNFPRGSEGIHPGFIGGRHRELTHN
jgi:hypothetical protein